MTDQRNALSPTTIAVALVVMLSSSFISLWFSYATGTGVAVAYGGLALNMVLGIFLWQGNPWARIVLIWRYGLTLVWAALLLFAFRDPIGAALAAAASASMLVILLGFAAPKRAYGGLVVYLVLVAVVALGVFQMIRRQQRMTDMVMEAGKPPRFESAYNYQVSFRQLPWKVLGRGEATQLLGQEIRDADLHVIRSDGSSFGLFFPLQFRNIALNEELSAMLEHEIQDKWLSDLNSWQTHPVSDGFLLTAKGEVAETPLSYVIFYKHFGNLGVYAVFWAEQGQEDQLYQEALLFYTNLRASPVKDRLAKLTPAETYQRNHNAVVLINTYDGKGNLTGKGSGFNVSPNGLIVTNLHVLTQGEKLAVVFPGRKEIKEVTVAGVSRAELDLALLKVPGERLPAVEALKTVPVAPGDKVYVIGSPKGLVNSVSEGIVGGIRSDGEVVLYQITAPISHGSSGGPVFNEYGEVIGVANAMALDAQNVNFSISIDELEHLQLLRQPITLEQLHEQIKP